MLPQSSETGSLQDIENLPISDRVDNLVDDYREHNLTPVAFCAETEEIPIDEKNRFPDKPAYISVKTTRQGNSGPETVILTEPRSLKDPNMVRRLSRSILVRQAILHPIDGSTAPDFLRHFRFPEVIETRDIMHPTEGRWVRSTMESYIPSKPLGSIHLADPTMVTDHTLLQMTKFHRYYQHATQKYAYEENFYHRYISNPFQNHGEGVKKEDMNKWWLDYEGRKVALTEIFDPQFVKDQGELLNNPQTAALFGKRVCVVGNVIPAVLGMDDDWNIVFKSMERAAYTDFLLFDDASLLSTLVSSPDHALQYMRYIFQQNPTRMAFEHLRGAIVFDKAGNLLGIQNALTGAKKRNDNEKVVHLQRGFDNLRSFVEDALYEKNFWDPAKYKLS